MVGAFIVVIVQNLMFIIPKSKHIVYYYTPCAYNRTLAFRMLSPIHTVHVMYRIVELHRYTKMMGVQIELVLKCKIDTRVSIYIWRQQQGKKCIPHFFFFGIRCFERTYSTAPVYKCVHEEVKCLMMHWNSNTPYLGFDEEMGTCNFPW